MTNPLSGIKLLELVPSAEADSIPDAMSDPKVRHLGLFHQLG